MEQSDKEWANPEAAQKEAEQRAEQEAQQAQQAAQAQTANAPVQTQPANPRQNAVTSYLENERKQANKYVIISLCCRYAPAILASLLGVLGYSISGVSETADSSFDMLTSLCSLLGGSGYLASWVFAIVARTKFKSAKSPKVLIIVYLVLLGLEILTAILLFMLLMAIIQSCSDAVW